jgi:hypothetical protein
MISDPGEREFVVDFILVGAQKCGTTTLANILDAHPSVVCCSEKEPHFFSSCNSWKQEITDYEALFDKRREQTLYFEASTTYTFYPHFNLEIWRDIYAYNKNMKIVYVVRDPIQRITSGYMHLYERGYTDLSFEKALLKEPSILNITRYAMQIQPFIDQFGRDNVCILFFEDLVEDVDRVVGTLSEFLQIDNGRFRDLSSFHANKSIGGRKQHHKYDNPNIFYRAIRRLAPPLWKKLVDNSDRSFEEKPELPAPLQRAVLHMLELDIAALEGITDRDLSTWREV